MELLDPQPLAEPPHPLARAPQDQASAWVETRVIEDIPKSTGNKTGPASNPNKRLMKRPSEMSTDEVVVEYRT